MELHLNYKNHEILLAYSRYFEWRWGYVIWGTNFYHYDNWGYQTGVGAMTAAKTAIDMVVED